MRVIMQTSMHVVYVLHEHARGWECAQAREDASRRRHAREASKGGKRGHRGREADGRCIHIYIYICVCVTRPTGSVGRGAQGQ